VNHVLWDNVAAVAGLLAEGSRLIPDEPGIARIEIDLPTPAGGLDDRIAHRLLRTFAHYLHDMLERIPPIANSARTRRIP